MRVKINFWVLCIISIGCGKSFPAESETSSNPPNTNPPVETRSPNASYQSSFIGQTRVPAVKTTTPIESKVVTSVLTRPWGITSLPDGRFLITEKGGTMRIVSMTGQVGGQITGIPLVNSAGQGGLLGIAIDPDFSSNHMIYWVFSEKRSDSSTTSVAKGSLSANEQRIDNATVIYRVAPLYPNNMHFGGRILFDKTGNIIFSTGERSDLPIRAQAQDLNSGLGKIIRITKGGQPAPGNPSLGAGSKSEFYSYGHRNVQGLAFEPLTGELWESEMGPRGGDEINRIQPGKNYGWPVIGYGLEYSGQMVGLGITQQNGMEQPAYYWDPVVSPSGITFYNSDYLSEWKNNLFVSGLSGSHIARLVISNGKVTGEERLLTGEGQRFRDITQGKDGALYTVTDEGRMYRIGRKN